MKIFSKNNSVNKIKVQFKRNKLEVSGAYPKVRYMMQGINGDACTESVNCYVPTPYGRTKAEREAAICVCFPRVSPTHSAMPRALYIFDTAHGRSVKESSISLI